MNTHTPTGESMATQTTQSAQHTPGPRDLVAQLQAADDAACAAVRANKTPETMAAARASSAALSAAIVAAGMLPKARGNGCRAGKRQQAERRAIAKGKP